MQIPSLIKGHPISSISLPIVPLIYEEKLMELLSVYRSSGKEGVTGNTGIRRKTIHIRQAIHCREREIQSQDKLCVRSGNGR